MFSLSRHPAKPAAGNTGSATSPAVSSQPTSRLTSSRRHPSSSPIVRRANRRTLATVASLLAAGLTLTACGGDSSNPTDATTEAPQLTVLSHDSFVLTDEAMTAFEVETGIDVTYLAPGDAGSVVNQLILTRDHPLGDVVFGIDNTLAGRALEADVLDPYQSPDLPLGLDALKADDTN
ncbi:MAG: hypothetical protein LBL92_03775, partial [Propionibacteriaceae bacterium]|nr:hypothetical protein [Propionibacteriaceae bacterium]